MDAARWLRMRKLFDAAATLDPASRDAWLNGATTDAALRDAVRKLLAAHDAEVIPDDARVATALANALGAAELAHDATIGGFRIERLLGEGGMGRVYLATRPIGGAVQRVALKIVPFAVHDRRTIERLRHERAILASLDHPNIARLIDAGELPDERPYFAMEYVDGVSIARYCDAHTLDLRARLALFADVCDAVA
ncbi:MAG TPA: protein kinase, partial [Tahibacter sp.]|nr:protein kinase [Tahibacter sp.]